jgi:predicted HTH domain antitoxin
MSIQFDMPKEILSKVAMSPDAFMRYAKGLVAVDLYRSKGVSLGYCAQVAGLRLEAFMVLLGEYKVSIFNFGDAEEFIDDSKNA